MKNENALYIWYGILVIFLIIVVLWGRYSGGLQSSSEGSEVAFTRIGKVTDVNIESLLNKLAASPALRKKAISRLQKGLYVFAEEAFELTPKEKTDMRRALPDRLAKMTGDFVLWSLETRGKISVKVTKKTIGNVQWILLQMGDPWGDNCEPDPSYGEPLNPKCKPPIVKVEIAIDP